MSPVTEDGGENRSPNWPEPYEHTSLPQIIFDGPFPECYKFSLKGSRSYREQRHVAEAIAQ